jgi:hypothetical protein
MAYDLAVAEPIISVLSTAHAATVEQDAFTALGQWPIIQAAVAILIALGGAYAVFRGSKDGGKSTSEGALANARLRLDLQNVLAANRDAVFNDVQRRIEPITARTDVLGERIGRLEVQIAVLQTRLDQHH